MNATFAATPSSRLPLPAVSSQGGYRLSSDELSMGLDMRALNISELPAELLRELLRLRRVWDPTATDMPG